MPKGNNPVSGHMYADKGWAWVTSRVTNGERMFIIEWWGGYTFLMAEDVFNDTISKLGCGTLVFSDQQIDAIRQKTIMEKIIDLMKNLILAYQQLLLKSKPNIITPMQPTQAIKYPRIVAWANAIKQIEGWSPTSPSCVNNNPGNLGYTSLTASWGGMKSGAKTDGGNFCKFKDYDTGFQALCNFLVLGAEDELKAFHQARTLGDFSKVYGNTGSGYGQQIANILNVPVTTNISTFLA
jgi:hypothetical protein